MLNWLAKAEKKANGAAENAMDAENERIQGSYTDHSTSPYQRRMQNEPMHGEELEQFNHALEKLEKKYGEARLKDLIEYGLDDGWFTVDKQGMLRVNMELPE